VRDIARARLTLGQELKELRLDAQLTGRQLAARFGWQASKISKIESGKQAPSDNDIQAWCEATNRPEKVDSLIAALRAMETLYGEWPTPAQTRHGNPAEVMGGHGSRD